MSEMKELLSSSAARIFSDFPHGPAQDVQDLNRPLWLALAESGMVAAALPVEAGGAGADLEDALAVIREAGAANARVPLAETMIAGLALAKAGLSVPDGMLTVGPVLAGERLHLTRAAAGWTLSGTLRRIPYARYAQALVAIAQCEGGWATVLVRLSTISEEGANMADEPRDTVAFDSVHIEDGQVSQSPQGMTPDDLNFYGALFRSVAISGALSRALEMSVGYAKERKQFGRAISGFQAVQQQLAVLAAQVAAASAAADAAVAASREGLARFEIAAAKCRVAEAATMAASIAHQVHGAMGFAREYPLHETTRRLWSWRDEFGSEHEWADWVGGVVAELGSSELWSYLTLDKKPAPQASYSKGVK